MRTLQFVSAMALAKWINANITDPLCQERLMAHGVANNYRITVLTNKQ